MPSDCVILPETVPEDPREAFTMVAGPTDTTFPANINVPKVAAETLTSYVPGARVGIV